MLNFILLASFGEVMSYIGYVLAAILMLLVMITVHEFGHYIAGKIFGFGINEFAIGFGPAIFKKKKKNGETFSVRVFPVGGFCAFKGEDADDDDPAAFNNKKPWQRIIVTVAGALMNYLFAVLVILLMFGIYGQTALMSYKTAPDTEGQYAGASLSDRDVIISADGRNVYILSDLMQTLSGREEGEIVNMTVNRGGEYIDVPVKLRRDTHFKNVEDMRALYDALGIYYETDAETGEMVNGGMYTTYIRLPFFTTIGHGFEYSFKLAGSVFSVLGQLITGVLGINSLGGTVTTISVAANAIRVGGFSYLLNVAALIGVNLALFNLLPIPALDGSRVVFILIEWIRKKPINRRVEAIIHTVGLVLLLVFAVVIDLQQCF